MPFDGVPFLFNAERLVLEAEAVVFAPPPPIDYEAWAVERVVFGQESPFPGNYQPTRYPYFRPILAALSPEDPCREVSVCGSAQIGKTVIAQIFTGGSLDLDPGPFLYVHPTEPNAIRWSRQKWRPFQRASLRDVLKSTTSRESGASLLYQERRDERGFIQMSGANSEASLSMVSFPRQVQDDLSKWEMNNAGDPEAQADSRSMAFRYAKVLKLSTPLVDPGCRITRDLQAGTQEHFHVPCPHCGHLHPLEWDNMLACLDEEHPEDVHFTCPDCGSVIEERHREGFERYLLEHDPVPYNPAARNRHRSFYIWSAYSPSVIWAQIAAAWIKAKGDPAREQTFLNDWVGRAYKAAGEAPPWEAIRDRAEETGHRRGEIPAGYPLLCLGIDVQGDWLAWHLKAFGRELRRATVDYGVIEGYVGDTLARVALNALLAKTWPDVQGKRRALDLVAIDGNAYTEDVWDWARKHPMSRQLADDGRVLPGVIMVRGVASDAAPNLARVQRERGKDGKIKRYVRRFFNVGVSPLKMALYKCLQKVDPLERGYVAYPQGLDDAFYQELCAERRSPIRNRRTGFTSYLWVKDPNQRNEVLDTEIQAEAAAIRCGWRRNTDEQWDRLEAEREAAPPPAQLDLEDLPLGEAARQNDANAVRTASATEAPRGSGAERLARLNQEG